MRLTVTMIAVAVGLFTLANLWEPGPGGVAMAQEESNPIKSARGGALAKVGQYGFEVFFYPTGLRLFPEDAAGTPLDASKLTGTATFYHPNSPEPWFARPLHPVAAGSGGTSESLDLVIGLGAVPPTGAKVAFEVTGLPDPAKPTARFTVPFAFVEAPAEPARRAPAEEHGYAPIGREAHFFPLPGWYKTPAGFVWVPARGYYHVPEGQYFPPATYPHPTSWGLAHPAPWPNSTVMKPRRPDMTGIHTEYYWHPRAMDNKTDHDAWIRRQLEEKYGRASGY
jgi:hypothetical protein